MNTNMLAHPAVQKNLAELAARGEQFVDPGEGYLACGWIGKGRLAEPEDDRRRCRSRAVRAEPGREPRDRHGGADLRGLDPVRFVGNRSSGKMGYALAAEATARGARSRSSGSTRWTVPPVEQSRG